ncbi:MAG: hypothetical protein AAGE52_10990 [Myxococcota bacterium]
MRVVVLCAFVGWGSLADAQSAVRLEDDTPLCRAIEAELRAVGVDVRPVARLSVRCDATEVRLEGDASARWRVDEGDDLAPRVAEAARAYLLAAPSWSDELTPPTPAPGPETRESAAAQPERAESETAQSETAQSETAQSETAQSETAQSETAQSQATESEDSAAASSDQDNTEFAEPTEREPIADARSASEMGSDAAPSRRVSAAVGVGGFFGRSALQPSGGLRVAVGFETRRLVLRTSLGTYVLSPEVDLYGLDGFPEPATLRARFVDLGAELAWALHAGPFRAELGGGVSALRVVLRAASSEGFGQGGTQYAWASLAFVHAGAALTLRGRWRLRTDVHVGAFARPVEITLPIEIANSQLNLRGWVATAALSLEATWGV